MTFPVVATKGTSTETPATTSHDVVLPTGITSGDLLVMFANLSGSNATTITAGMTGWTNILEFTGNVTLVPEVWYKFASGGETTFQYTTSLSVKSATHCWRITGAHASSAPEIGAGGPNGVTTNFGTTPLSPSWGAEDTLWICFACRTGDGGTITVYPTNYSGNQVDHFKSGASSSDAAVCFCSRTLNSATEDPGTWTGSVSVASKAKTVGIRPAGAVGGFTPESPFGTSGFYGV